MKVPPYYHSPRRPPGSPRPRVNSLGASRASGAEPGERRLIARHFDAFQLGFHAIERGARLVVLVPGIGQVLPDHVERVAKLVDVAAQPPETALDLPRVLLD